jgi:hypothetical protein
MQGSTRRLTLSLIAVGTAGMLMLAGCGSDSKDNKAASAAPSAGASPSAAAPATGAAEGAPSSNDAAAAPAAAAATATGNAVTAAPAASGAASTAAPAVKVGGSTVASKQAAGNASAPAASGGSSQPGTAPGKSAPGQAAPAAAAGSSGNGGATDVGVTDKDITLGSIYSYGWAFSDLGFRPMQRQSEGWAKLVNDTGGIYGRHIKFVICDDGAPDPARTKACYKKLTEQDKIFAFTDGCSLTEMQYQADLQRDKIPWFGPCSLYREEWQNPFAFPVHMDMSQEAYANAIWVSEIQHPKTYGIMCLNNPGMLLACKQAEKAFDSKGVKQVWKRVFEEGTPDMSGDVVAARAAAPDLILHYTLDPTIHVRFFIDAAQQNYWPPMGISGNHMALEVIGSLMGEFPAQHGYRTTTAYKLWGADFINWQKKYAPGNRGLGHHVLQGMWFAHNVLQECMQRAGANLTRDSLVKCHYGQAWETGPQLGQKFIWTPGHRYDAGSGNTTEYMYKYVNKDTYAQDNGSPTGFVPDPDRFMDLAPPIDPNTGTGQ